MTLHFLPDIDINGYGDEKVELVVYFTAII
jgi:hypothetical protein